MSLKILFTLGQCIFFVLLLYFLNSFGNKIYVLSKYLLIILNLNIMCRKKEPMIG